MYKPPGWYRGRPGATWGWSHPCLVGTQCLALPGAPRPRRRGCRTQSAGEQAQVAPWGACPGDLRVAKWGPLAGTPTPSLTLLWSRASGQSVISVKSFIAVGDSRCSLAKSLPGALCSPAQPPSPPTAPPQLPPSALGRRGDPRSTHRGRGGGSASCAYTCHPSAGAHGAAPRAMPVWP